MSSAQALVPKNMNTNLCNNTYLFSPPTAAALEQYTSFQILYHCIIVSLYHCIFAPSFITNIVISYFSFDKLFLIWQYQEYFTLTCKNTFRGQSRKQACLWLPLDGFLWNTTKCQQHNCELSWNISIYLSIYGTILWSQLWFGSFVVKSESVALIFIAAHCSCKPNLPHANYHFACFIQWPRLLLNHSFESLFCSWHYILHGVYDILRHSICCIVLISHCEIISGVIRYGPYHLDSTDVHLHVLLKICVLS